jgi:hypothetical protein
MLLSKFSLHWLRPGTENEICVRHTTYLGNSSCSNVLHHLFFYLVGWDLTPLGPFAGPLG